MEEVYSTTIEAVTSVAWLRKISGKTIGLMDNPFASETGYLKIVLTEAGDRKNFIKMAYLSIIRTWEENECSRSLRCILQEKYKIHLLEEMFEKAIQGSDIVIPMPVLLRKQDGILFSCLENGKMIRGKKIFIIP